MGSEDIDSGDASVESDEEESGHSSADEDAASEENPVATQGTNDSNNDADGDDDVGDLSWEAVMAAMQDGGSDAEAEEEQQPDDHSLNPLDAKAPMQKTVSKKGQAPKQKGRQNSQAKASGRTTLLGKRIRQR